LLGAFWLLKVVVVTYCKSIVMTQDTTQEKELILKGLCRDRDELTARLSEVERLIKKIKSNAFSLVQTPVIEDTNNVVDITPVNEPIFPVKAELKFQVLAIIDMIGFACKLKDIQERFKDLTGSTYNLRETLRTLNKHNVIKLLRPKNSDRGLYWVKTDWLEDNNTKLQDKYKFFGFDMIYKQGGIEFI
jgi:hypothetical protein